MTFSVPSTRRLLGARSLMFALVGVTSLVMGLFRALPMVTWVESVAIQRAEKLGATWELKAWEGDVLSGLTMPGGSLSVRSGGRLTRVHLDGPIKVHPHWWSLVAGGPLVTVDGWNGALRAEVLRAASGWRIDATLTRLPPTVVESVHSEFLHSDGDISGTIAVRLTGAPGNPAGQGALEADLTLPHHLALAGFDDLIPPLQHGRLTATASWEGLRVRVTDVTLRSSLGTAKGKLQAEATKSGSGSGEILLRPLPDVLRTSPALESLLKPYRTGDGVFRVDLVIQRGRWSTQPLSVR